MKIKKDTHVNINKKKMETKEREEIYRTLKIRNRRDVRVVSREKSSEEVTIAFHKEINQLFIVHRSSFIVHRSPCTW